MYQVNKIAKEKQRATRIWKIENHTSTSPYNLVTIILVGSTQSLFIHHCKYLVVSQSLNQLEIHELIPYLQIRY